jgi:hypothetical protein
VGSPPVWESMTVMRCMGGMLPEATRGVGPC